MQDEALESASRALALAAEHRREVMSVAVAREPPSPIHQECGDEAEARITQLRADHDLEDPRMKAEIHRLRSLALERRGRRRSARGKRPGHDRAACGLAAPGARSV